MPPRPAFSPRSIALPSSQWTCRSCFRRTQPLTRPWNVSLFHSTARRQADSIPNHYETLQLSSSASATDIKRQFYTLSKQHHPDRNPDDPTASTRFVAISEAYHVLAVPEKRAQYDAQLSQSQGRSRWGNNPAYPQGSYSSAAFGSRPASGLNKKRSTFRGPPPSFYKSGGYGKHGAKRAEHAYNPNGDGKGGGEEAPKESYGDFGGGFGPGQQAQGHEVPHFDDRRHKQMHDSVNEHISARRERARRRAARAEAEIERSDFLMRFIIVTGVIGIIGITAKVLSDRDEAREKRRKDEI